MLQIRNLTGGYSKDHDILQGVNLDIAKGDSVGIIGLNGSGKSTLAKAIVGILPHSHGEILFNGKSITWKSTSELSAMGIALFMQGGRVFDELSVWDNLQIASKTKKECEICKIKDSFVSLRLSKRHLSTMRADKLSGGERHSLALAICMLRKPSLLVLDEPTAGLDPAAVDSMYQTLNDLRNKNGLTILLIEQNVARAVDFCSTVSMLRNGKIEYSSNNLLVSSSAYPPKSEESMHLLQDKSLILKEIELNMFNN